MSLPRRPAGAGEVSAPRRTGYHLAGLAAQSPIFRHVMLRPRVCSHVAGAQNPRRPSEYSRPAPATKSKAGTHAPRREPDFAVRSLRNSNGGGSTEPVELPVLAHLTRDELQDIVGSSTARAFPTSVAATASFSSPTRTPPSSSPAVASAFAGRTSPTAATTSPRPRGRG